MNEIRAKRMQSGYSIGDMALMLGMPKATYQCYENGTRAAPADILDRMQEIEAREKEFFARYLPGGEYDQHILREYPRGITGV